MRFVQVLSTIAAAEAYLVLVLGKIVNLTGASKSIPDWPLAFGRLVPKMSFLVFWEWSHRLCVLLVFVTTVALIISAAWLSWALLLYCLISLLLLLVPAVIGAIAIRRQRPLHWAYLALDQATAVLFFASVVGLAVWSYLAQVGAG